MTLFEPDAILNAGDALAEACESLLLRCNEHDRRELEGRIDLWRRIRRDIEERRHVFHGATAKLDYPEGTFLIGTVTLDSDGDEDP